MTTCAAVRPQAPSRLAYPFNHVPQPGAPIEVADGVFWLRMPMPMRLDHINVWALAEGDAWTIVDSGLQNEATSEEWARLLGGPAGPASIKRVLVTHMHPDHVGMAGDLCRRFDCELWMTRLEYLTCRVLRDDTGRPAPEQGVRFYRAAGWNESQLDSYRQRFGNFGLAIDVLPESYRRLNDGEFIDIGGWNWQVVVGRGHSPEHACFYCPERKLFISGDQVLPRISSNVSVFPMEPEADPLGDWLDSIEAIRRRVPDDVLVLPAHQEPFRGLHERLDQLRTDHLESLDRLRRALDEPKRVVDVFGSLFHRAITGEPHLLFMATGECMAHLSYLRLRGEVKRERDADGVDWYRRVARATPL